MLLLCHCVACLSCVAVSSEDLFSWTLMLRICAKLLVSFCCQYILTNNALCVRVCVHMCVCAMHTCESTLKLQSNRQQYIYTIYIMG